ncbi:hypothetical protein PICMEDRAFT_16042 [Pichia membranifaciens NRRL Y-2026]|uniref:Zinc finger PHD-type domain-containing protein n=1 Tax=Pichia membranifaciens NRRL Y-2026 TaxID=763406 RepID=A0A1E3NQ70_9ASCO|nr:hypothetical protein PICMEDRAFT_16042 [Pichia membranifaciens NRRL Y-2026]ODQ48231.1 hypothetical protein PICMEDRAFT_16042 [Pichia membranifaciens NRRL Y-2026]
MSSRRSRRAHSTQPKYATEDFEMDTDFDSYNNNNDITGSASKRSSRARTDEPDSHRRDSRSQDPEQEQEQKPDQDLDDINEVEEVTRCICGSDDLYVPKNSHEEFDNVDPGFFIQCEICAVWQHGYCVGIKDEENAPEKYWCEQCKPENHTLFTDRFGIRRSKYDPTHENAGNSSYSSSASMNSQKKSLKRKNGRFVSTKAENPESADDLNEVKKERKPSEVKAIENEESTENHNNDHEMSQNEEEYEDDDGHRRKHRKRSSYSYRDYNYEEMLKKALEESAKESGVVPEEVNISSSEGPGGVRETRTTSLRKNRAKLHDDISLTAPENEDSNPETESELPKVDDGSTKTDTELTEVKPEKVEIYKKPKIEERRRARDPKRTRPRRTTSATSASNDEHEEDNDDRSDAKSVSTKASSSSFNSKNTTNPNTNSISSTPKRSSAKREKKDSKPPATDDKPFRANIPSARISMNEMTRRIFSIMDFVSNIQINLSNEEEFKNNLFKMNDSELTQEITELKSTLIGCYNDSIDQLDQLTNLLNTWQNNHA